MSDVLGPGTRGRWLVSALLTALLCLAPQAAAGSGVPMTLTAAAGGVTATLTTTPGLSGSRAPGRLTIVDNGTPSFAGPLGFRCSGCVLTGAGALQIRRLTPVGPDDVLVSLADADAPGEALAVYRRTAAGTYAPVVLKSLFLDDAQQLWQAAAVRVGRSMLLQSDDLRFLPFVQGTEQFGALPRVLWQFGPSTGGLVAVTAHFPALLRRETARALSNARKDERLRPGNDADNEADPRGELAVYAEAATELGHRATAERALRTALADGWLNETTGLHGSRYIAELNRLLGTPDTEPAGR
jgi:hypothetical protein